MRTSAIVVLGAAVIFAAMPAAFAADFPGEPPIQPIPVVAPSYTWQGWYVGAETLWDISLQARHNVDTKAFNLRGGHAGINFGYDWQFGNWLVFGPYAALTGGKFEGMDAFATNDCTQNCIVQIQALAIFGGRFCVAIGNWVMPYARVGTALGWVNAGFTGVGTHANWVAGFEVAGGADIRVSQRALLFGELTYLSLGDTHFAKDTFQLIPGAGARFGFRYKL
jgi:outer membrane immunogenic protein